MQSSSKVAKEDDAATASIIDSLSHMMKKECTTYSCCDYLNESNCDIKSSCCGNSDKITPDDRMKVVDWCYDIVDKCHLDRDAVAVAMNLADRFMSSQDTTEDILYHRGQYQLLIISALYLSIKINEAVSFSSDEFAAITHDTYSREEIEDMEQKILHRLEWRLCVPTAQAMGTGILDLLELMSPQVVQVKAGEPKVEEEVGQVSLATWDFLRYELAYQNQNAVREYYFTTQRCSTIAAVATLNAIEQVNDAEYDFLVKALLCVLKKFDFDEASVLLEARHRLSCFIDDNDVSTIM
ncbi:hypothetical protein ACHAXR_005629 [Thalassiosira sp. AJA248-18]